jgi:hypothetical protein
MASPFGSYHDEGKTMHRSLPVAQEDDGRGFRVGFNEPEDLLQSCLESIAKADLARSYQEKAAATSRVAAGEKRSFMRS